MSSDTPAPWSAAEWNAALQSAHRLISEGRPTDALAATEALLAREDLNGSAVVSCAGFLIDLGAELDDLRLVHRGVGLLESLVGKGMPPSTGRAARYNLANGLECLGRAEVASHAWTYWGLQENEKCRRAQHLFAGLLEDEDAEATAEHWTNYGNRLSHVGRKLEALYAYDRALGLDPAHPMATGNKGEALECIAPMLGVSATATLVEAGRLLAAAIANPRLASIGGSSPCRHWTADLDRIQSYVGQVIGAEQARSHPAADLSSHPPALQRFLVFARDERLFLTYHLCDEEASAALRDSVFIRVLDRVDSEPGFPGVALRFNQLKEDYAVARYQAFLAIDRDPDRDAISQLTTLADLDDGSVFHLYGGMLKAAFGRAFDVLDKIAFFLNDYLHLGIASKRIGFRTFWKSNASGKARTGDLEAGAVRAELRDRDDYGVVSLVDLAQDLEETRFKRIVDLRNAQTHRCLVLTTDTAHVAHKDGIERIGRSTMLWETLRLLRMVKSALFSLAVVVDAEERRRAGPGPRAETRRDVGTEQHFD